MTEREKGPSEKTPYELTKQLETMLSLIGDAPSRQEELKGEKGSLIVDVYDDEPIQFASEIRIGLEELLKQSNITNSYKLHLKDMVEFHLTSPVVRMHARVWFGNSVMPILEECGIDLEETWTTEILPKGRHRHVPQPTELGIFEPDKDKLRVLEKDILRLRLGGWGSSNPKHGPKMQKWSEEFRNTYGENAPKAHEGSYENPVIRRIWIREQY